MNQIRTSADDRKLQNVAIEPSKQFRLAFYMLALGLGIFLAFFAFELWLMSSIVTNLAPLAPQDSNLHQLLGDSLWWSWAAFILIAVLFSMGVILGTLVLSHRFFGPVVALQKHINALTRGEFEHRTHLRKNDELKELAADLNQLSERLESQTKSSS